jgi:acetyl-CoA acetyltransferase family protein
MPLKNAHIPYGAYWTTPFCRWQGSLSGYHAIELAGGVGKAFLDKREIAPDVFDSLFLGITVTQRSAFYGAPWLAGLLGAPKITGPTLSQACATSPRVLADAAKEIELGERDCILTVCCDRTSNGPHVYFPDPGGPGGTGQKEDVVLDSFGKDPWAGSSMLQTAENVAKKHGIGRKEQDELTLLRNEQYLESLANDRAFQQRYFFPVELRRGRKVTGLLEKDEGIFSTTAEGLAGLRPMLPDGTVTFGSQTHPADANAGMVVCGAERAKELSTDPSVTVRLLAFGDARAEKAMMPEAVAPAAHQALSRAGITIGDCAAVKLHNPFAVGDLLFCRQLELEPAKVNRFGSSLIYGHPQAPMGMRMILELIEELVEQGGGYGLFAGCAGGDTAMAVVLQVS